MWTEYITQPSKRYTMRPISESILAWGSISVACILMLARIIIVPNNSESWGLPSYNTSQPVATYTSTDVATVLGYLAFFSGLYAGVTSICVHCCEESVPTMVEWLASMCARNSVNAWVAITGTDIALLLSGHKTEALVGLDATIVCLLNSFSAAEEIFIGTTVVYSDKEIELLGSEAAE